MKKGPTTRSAILQEAFRLSYTSGYQQSSIDDILRNLGITKGAFYHHFTSKEEMGTALIDELMAPQMEGMYRTLLAAHSDPLKAIHRMMKRLLFEEPQLMAEYGCPMGNLAQELGAADTPMREALSRIMEIWRGQLKGVLKQAISEGIMQKGRKPDAIAAYVISGYWGVRTLGKISAPAPVYKAWLSELERYLDSLRES
jgi:AcrR family transcriptional regulator